MPQIASPTKPSQYLSNNYEEYYYNNYLLDLLSNYELDIPNKEDYMKQIHSDKPKCMEKIKEKYNNDSNFNKKTKEISSLSIEKHIQNTDLNIIKINEYLLKTQNEKIYMLYKNKKLKLQKIQPNNYKIISYIKSKNSYIATTEAGSTLTILLRWKNGNGIAFPAFQIGLKIINK